MQGCLEEEDMVALRKLRDDASGALKEYFGDSEDPREEIRISGEASFHVSRLRTVG